MGPSYHGGARYKVTLVKGRYYPIRFVWAQTNGSGHFEMVIRAPDGTVIVDDKTTISPYLVKFGCKEAYGAKEFPPWGAES